MKKVNQLVDCGKCDKTFKEDEIQKKCPNCGNTDMNNTFFRVMSIESKGEH